MTTFKPGAICRAHETLEPKYKATWRGRTGSEILPTGASMTLSINEARFKSFAPLASALAPRTLLEKRDLYFRRRRSLKQGAKLALANAHFLSSVPISQIVFYFNCREEEVARWVRATHKSRVLGYTKWRHELDLYEIAHIPPEDFN